MTVLFQLEGQEFLALNGGPLFKFSEAVSFLVNCKDQEEVDYYWQKLLEGGEEGNAAGSRINTVYHGKSFLLS